MLKFFIFFSVLTVLNAYIVSRLAAHAPVGVSSKMVWIVGGVFFALQALAFIAGMHALPYLQSLGGGWFVLGRVFSFITYTAMGVAFAMVVYVLFADIAKFIAIFFVPNMSPITIRHFFFYGALTVTIFTTVIGLYQAYKGPRIERITITSSNIPEVFDGYKMVHLTDLHAGPVIRKKYVERVVDMVRAENADIILQTGDYTDGFVENLKNDLLPLKSLTAPDGIYFAEGNHEHYRDHQNWLALYKKWGWGVLNNEHRTITRGSDHLVIGGVYDYGTVELPTPYATDPFVAIKGAPDNAYNILLAHQPADYERTAKAGFDLLLAGHTHGGQFFPWTLFIGFAHKYADGLYDHDDRLKVYVNRGVGYWGPPLRTFSTPIISVITLQKK